MTADQLQTPIMTARRKVRQAYWTTCPGLTTITTIDGHILEVGSILFTVPYELHVMISGTGPQSLAAFCIEIKSNGTLMNPRHRNHQVNTHRIQKQIRPWPSLNCQDEW
jgi:hypothetical protein